MKALGLVSSYLGREPMLEMVVLLKMLHGRDRNGRVVFQDLRTNAVLVDVGVVGGRRLTAAERPTRRKQEEVRHFPGMRLKQNPLISFKFLLKKIAQAGGKPGIFKFNLFSLKCNALDQPAQR